MVKGISAKKEQIIALLSGEMFVKNDEGYVIGCLQELQLDKVEKEDIIVFFSNDEDELYRVFWEEIRIGKRYLNPILVVTDKPLKARIRRAIFITSASFGDSCRQISYMDVSTFIEYLEVLVPLSEVQLQQSINACYNPLGLMQVYCHDIKNLCNNARYEEASFLLEELENLPYPIEIREEICRYFNQVYRTFSNFPGIYEKISLLRKEYLEKTGQRISGYEGIFS